MNTHLTDFPIRPARVAPVGIHPAMVARTLNIDVDGLVGALETFGVEDIGAVEVNPHVNAYRAPVGTGDPVEAGQPDLTEDEGRHPHIVALRLDGGRVRSVRLGLDYSQDRFAKAIRAAGAKLGEPNGCTKRAVQKWESGEVTLPRPHLRKALEAVTRMPFVTLCTPVLPPNADEASQELSAIATEMNNLVHRMARLYSYLAR